MTHQYFVSRLPDGTVLHLVRITRTETTLVGEYFVDGEWIAHGSATDYLVGGDGDEIDADEAQRIIASFMSADEPATPDATHHDVFRSGLRALLPDDAPELPDPIPARGAVSDNHWTVRFALNADEDGELGLDFYADNPYTSSIHGRIADDGAVTMFDVMESQFSYDPEIEGDREAAEQRLQRRNEQVADELRRKGLI